VELQHVNVKLFLANPERVQLEALIPVFHSWIQDEVCEELLVDVADYSHVHSGPGVVLIGHQGNYSVDNADSRLGLRYNCKTVLEGNNQDRLTQATRAALAACQRLEADPRLDGSICFNGQDVEVFINDRLIVPNSEASREALAFEFHTFFRALFGEGQYALAYGEDSRRPFSVSVRAFHRFGTAALLNSLACVSSMPDRA